MEIIKKAALEAGEAVSIMHLPLTDNFTQSTMRAVGARSLCLVIINLMYVHTQT